MYKYSAKYSLVEVNILSNPGLYLEQFYKSFQCLKFMYDFTPDMKNSET